MNHEFCFTWCTGIACSLYASDYKSRSPPSHNVGAYKGSPHKYTSDWSKKTIEFLLLSQKFFIGSQSHFLASKMSLTSRVTLRSNKWSQHIPKIFHRGKREAGFIFWDRVSLKWVFLRGPFLDIDMTFCNKTIKYFHENSRKSFQSFWRM